MLAMELEKEALMGWWWHRVGSQPCSGPTAPTVLEWDHPAVCNCGDWTDFVHFIRWKKLGSSQSDLILYLCETFYLSEKLEKVVFCQPSVLMSDLQDLVTGTSNLEPSGWLVPPGVLWVGRTCGCLGVWLPRFLLAFLSTVWEFLRTGPHMCLMVPMAVSQWSSSWTLSSVRIEK